MGKEYGDEREATFTTSAPLLKGLVDVSRIGAPTREIMDTATGVVYTQLWTLPRQRAFVWSVESPERLAELAEEYVTYLETAETDKVCLCLWRIHPDDVALTEKRRRTLVDEHPQCPVHTKAGRLVGFIEWLTGPADGG